MFLIGSAVLSFSLPAAEGESTEGIKLLIFPVIFLCGTFLQSQEITGQWNGVLSVPGANQRLVVYIGKTGESYTYTMDSS